MTDESVYKTPASDLSQKHSGDVRYAGFWVRVLASLIDTILMLLITLPLLTMIYGNAYWQSSAFYSGTWDLVLNYLFPAVAVILFWIYRSATPGKMVLGLRIVRENSGEKVLPGRLVLRYVGYYLSMLPLFLGFIWIAFDRRKQGFHDKLSGTVVIKE